MESTLDTHRAEGVFGDAAAAVFVTHPRDLPPRPGEFRCFLLEIAPTVDLVHLLPPTTSLSQAPLPTMPSSLPSSGGQLLVSEKFVSLQGEGVSMGAPAAFLRLGNCNLACSFCDTPYTWDESRFNLRDELHPEEVSAVAEWVIERAPGRLIVTGGEPLLQQKQLEQLFFEIDARSDALGKARHFLEIETNGTVPPLSSLVGRVDQWNVSPKLRNSGEPNERRIRPAALRALGESGRAHFKFVIQAAEDVREVDELVSELGLLPERVILMPEATNAAILRDRSPQVAAEAMARRYRFSGRIHLELFGERRGT